MPHRPHHPAGEASVPAVPTKRIDIPAMLAEMDRRWAIIEEHHLRAEIGRLQALRRDHPEAWRRVEAQRIAGNREQAALNRALRAAGCRPVALQISLAQKVKKLQQLEERSYAKAAVPERPRDEFSNKSRRHSVRTSDKRRHADG